MTTINGTITNANPGPALYSAIETAMIADGWTLVDTVVIGSNTHRVLKSAAAGNAQNLDWYLDINYPTTGVAGGIRFCPFESYDAVTHTAVRGPYAPATTNTTIDATTYSRFGASAFALETNWANTATYTGLSHALTTAAFNYRISVTRNRLIAVLTNNPQQLAYAGFFTPSSAHASHAGAALFPLLMAKFVSSSVLSNGQDALTTAALTRLPKVTTLSNNGWEMHVAIPTDPTHIGFQPEGQLGVAVSPFTGRSTVQPLPVLATPSGTYSQHQPSNARPGFDGIGFVDDVGVGFVVGTSIREDTVTIGSDTWYGLTPTNNSSLYFKGI